jgi:CRISPR system Cascade subunit CasD
MPGLVLRFAAPLQSWGAEAAGEYRHTNRFPTRSGIGGLLCAALGYDRYDDTDKIEALHGRIRTHVRAVKPGQVLEDFHTVRDIPAGQGSIITHRYYLEDADFVCVVELAEGSPDPMVIADALRSPVFPLYLGRRACPPSLPPLVRTYNGEDPLDLLKTPTSELNPDYPEPTRIGSDSSGTFRVCLDGRYGSEPSATPLPDGYGRMTRIITVNDELTDARAHAFFPRFATETTVRIESGGRDG